MSSQDAMLSSWQFPYWAADFGAGGPVRWVIMIPTTLSLRRAWLQQSRQKRDGECFNPSRGIVQLYAMVQCNASCWCRFVES
eukprot:331392-Chlamydomonas_euryale.AAC.20